MIRKLKIIAKYIRFIVRYIILIWPLYWFVNVWLVFVFNVDTDLEIVPDPIATLFFLFGTPTIFFIGSIYTALKKMWWWFAAYIVLGFGFWIRLQIG